jgi:hypothetical protein
MRLSIVEDLFDDKFAVAVREFITRYGEELFHTRFLTLGNLRTILHQGVGTMFEELEETLGQTQSVPVLDDLESGELDMEEAAEITEFVVECLIDNFDRFMEYNTTTTYSDYGSRLYCLLDFLQMEAMYDRFEWEYVPWQLMHEVLVRQSETDVAEAVVAEVSKQTAETAAGMCETLRELEVEYGVKLPSLHDHVNEQIVGLLEQNAIAALVPKAIPGAAGRAVAETDGIFQTLRARISAFMKTRHGSGIEPPEWMQRLVVELDQVQEVHPGNLNSTLSYGEGKAIPMKELDAQLTAIRRHQRAR